MELSSRDEHVAEMPLSTAGGLLSKVREDCQKSEIDQTLGTKLSTVEPGVVISCDNLSEFELNSVSI